MEEKQRDTKSDHIKLFQASLGHIPDLKVSIKTEPQWMLLESESKLDDCASWPWETGNHSQDIKQEDTAYQDKNGKQDKNVKRTKTNAHPLVKKAKWELMEDMIEEETAVFSASIEKQDNEALSGTSDSEGSARSTPVPLPTEAEELRSNQHSFKGKMCHVCGLVFDTKSKRKKHQRTHEKVHHCVSCDKRFQFRHQIMHHKCRPKHIGNAKKPHIVQHHRYAIWSRIFPQAADLTAHQHLTHRQKCLVCGLLFVSQREKQEHQATHTLGLKIHQCGVCNKWFEYLPEFKTHIFLHNHFRDQVKQTMCKLCGAQFSEMEDLTVHLSMHSKLKCCICGVRFVTKKERKKHRTSHVRGEKKHHCTSCCSSFTVLEDLNAHMLTVTHRKKCQVCDLTFDTKKERKKHHSEHPAGEMTHYCTVCDKWFVTLSDIDKHILLKHMDILEKPYKCNVCGKAFLYAEALSDHKGKH